MDKYQLLISKIKKLNSGSHSNFSPAEIELITGALETIQVLEIIFRLRAKNSENHV